MEKQEFFKFNSRSAIKGFPELRWTGKRPFKLTQYFPAQLKETYGEPVKDWMNKIYWGDNLQVMSHLLNKFRGQVDLIYIDPPFDSKADYKRKIKVKGQQTTSDSSTFEEKQYGDIWTNDEYLQFMYERLILMRELLSPTGSIYLHCDWHKSHLLRCLCDEVFGNDKFIAEIIWHYSWGVRTEKQWNKKHDNILCYRAGSDFTFNANEVLEARQVSEATENRMKYKGALITDGNKGRGNEEKALPTDVWYIATINGMAKERLDYPTQKPEELVEKIIKASSNPGDIVFDCFMGSGTTQAVAMKLGRRFIGADINLGAIQTTTKRLLSVVEENSTDKAYTNKSENVNYTGFEVYNVNNYDFFRNPIEARDLIISALEIQPFPESNVWDGELNGRMVKIMPVNRIATKADLEGILANLPYKAYEERKEKAPKQPVESITIVCMGHEPDLKGALEQKLIDYKVDIEIMDILRNKAELQLKRDSEAEVVREGDKLVIRSFYPMNLMQKLSLQKEYVEEWRQLVDSVMIDWNFDGAIMQPKVTDIPGKNELVKGIYDIPEDAGTIKVKITDILSESLELEV